MHQITHHKYITNASNNTSEKERGRGNTCHRRVSFSVHMIAQSWIVLQIHLHKTKRKMQDQKIREECGNFCLYFFSSWLVRISYIGCTPPLPCCLLPCNISKRGRQSNHHHHHPPARPQFLSLFLGTFIFDQHHALPPHFIFFIS